MPLSFNQPCIATIHGCGIHVSGGVLVPQLASELSIFRFGSVTQYGIDVGAKRVSIRRRRHERVVEVHFHLAEERMEPVIHRCHRCIGGEVGADSSNHLSSDEQACVGKIEVGISCSRYHELYWTPLPSESRDVKGWCSTQRPSSILVCVGGTAKMSSSLFTPSHECRCTNAILRKHVCSLSSFGGRDTAQRPSSILVCVGGTAKMFSSLFTPSHECRCTNAILRKHVCSLSSFGGRDTATRCGSLYTFH